MLGLSYHCRYVIAESILFTVWALSFAVVLSTIILVCFPKVGEQRRRVRRAKERMEAWERRNV